MTGSRRRQARIRGLVDTTVLRRARVCVFGLGRVGASLALELARHGVATKAPGEIFGVDGDVVEEENTVGQPFAAAQQAGQSKAEALAELLRGVEPDVRLELRQLRITRGRLPRLIQRARDADVVVLAFDDFAMATLVADEVHDHAPTVFPLIYPRADGAEIAVSVPGQTPRISSVLGERRRERLSQASALGCDVLFCVSFATALVLRLILRSSRGSQLLPAVFSDGSLFVVGIRGGFLFDGLPSDVIRAVSVVRTA